MSDHVDEAVKKSLPEVFGPTPRRVRGRPRGKTPERESRDLLLLSLATDGRWSMRQVGALLGVSGERVRQIVRREGGEPVVEHRGGVGPKPILYARMLPEDRRRVRELMNLGMSSAEGVALLGYPAKSAQRETWGGFAKRSGHGANAIDPTWRGWKDRWMMELRKLIAGDALRKGATLAEAAEVSGVNRNSIGVWAVELRGKRLRPAMPRTDLRKS